MFSAANRFFDWIIDTPSLCPSENSDPKSALTCLYELRGPILVTTISAIAAFIFESALLTVGASFAGAHLLARSIQMLCAPNASLKKIEEFGLSLLRSYPYFYFVATIVAVLFCKISPLFSIILACSCGFLNGLTIELYSQSTRLEHQESERRATHTV